MGHWQWPMTHVTHLKMVTHLTMTHWPISSSALVRWPEKNFEEQGACYIWDFSGFQDKLYPKKVKLGFGIAAFIGLRDCLQ